MVFTHSLRLFAIGKDPTLKVFPYDDLSSFGLLAFFAISGYLVTRSAHQTADMLRFAKKRALRILPGLITCLLFTILVVGPLATTWPRDEYFSSWISWKYFLNVFLFPLQTDLPGTFLENPRQGTVNGSLWSLSSEVTAYFLVALAFHWRRNVVPILIAGVLILVGVYFVSSAFAGSGLIAKHVPYDMGNRYFFLIYFNYTEASRLIAVFFVGGLLNFVPENAFNRRAASICALLLPVFALTPLYSLALITVVPYAVVTFGRHPSAMSRGLNGLDLSYGIYLYHAPLMQLTWTLLHTSLGKLELVMVGVAMTLSAASLSWTLVERPMLLLKHQRERPKSSLDTESNVAT